MPRMGETGLGRGDLGVGDSRSPWRMCRPGADAGGLLIRTWWSWRVESAEMAVGGEVQSPVRRPLARTEEAGVYDIA